MKEYWSNLFSDPSFVGALLGAVITGLIAIIVMHRTNVNNRKRNKKEELNNFIKEAKYLLYCVEGLIEHIDVYIKHQQEEEIVKRTDTGPDPNPDLSEIRWAKRLNETDIAEYLRKIKIVNRNAFTRDTIDIYLGILNIVEEQVEYFWRRSLEGRASGVADILKEESRELVDLKDALKRKYEEKEKEYNSL